MRDLCLFAHFDKDDTVDEYVLRYLRHIKELNFAIVFVSTARLPPAEVDRVRSHCFDVILRENVGLDFGSWAAGFAKHHAAIDGRLLLANDSVYGPLGNLSAAVDRLTARPADFYGFVESIEIAPHLQSWFLLFEPSVVRHPAFTAIMSRSYPAMSKQQIIVQGEVDLSRRLARAGFRYDALYRSSQASLIERSLLGNPSHFLWQELLFEAGIPFLKVELLRDNPAGLEDAATILAAVDRFDPEFSSIIRRHLARMRSADAGRTELSTPRPRLSRYRRMLIRNAYRRRRQSGDLGGR
jgi:lipopolysaccharide biosynthesis protein